MQYRIMILILLIMIMAACAKIPPQAVLVANAAGDGIEALGENLRDVIAAWEEAQLRAIGTKWRELYTRAETLYREKRGESNTLTPEQHEEVAGLAALLKDELATKVRLAAAQMREQAAQNEAATLRLNQELIDLLTSARNRIERGKDIVGKILPKLPIPKELFDDRS